MNLTTHERPGVYSSYDASTLVRGSGGHQIVGLAAINSVAAAGVPITVTSYEAAVSTFGSQEGKQDMAELIRVALLNGAAAVVAVPVADEEGYEAAFQHAMDQIHQYPTCEKLIYTTIFYLDGARFLHGVPDPDAYTDRLLPFYESMSHSQTPEIRDAALTMCISYHRNRKDFAQAEELIQSIPSSTIDKEEQLAILYTQQEKYEQALPLWERRILHSATHIQTVLMNLMDIALKEGRDEDAQSCAQVYEQVSGLLHMTQWTPYIARLQLAILKKDRTGCLEVLSKVLPALTQPWEPQKSPIYRTLNGGDVTAIAQQLRILDDLEHSEEFAFFRDSPEYEQLRPLLENEG